MARPYKRSMRSKRFRNKWFLEGSLGPGVPFIGGSKVRFGTKAKKAAFTKAVKAVVHKQIQTTQYKVFSGSVSATSLLHNNFYTLNLLGNIPRGEDWNERIGDIIHISAIDLNLTLYSNIATNQTNSIKFKYWVIRDEDEYNGGSDNFVLTGPGAGKLLNAPNYNTQGIWDPKQVTVVASGSHVFTPPYLMLDATPALRSTVDQVTHKILITPNAKFTYETGTNFGKPPNYYLVVTASEYGGVNNTTVVGAMFLDGSIKFKNSQ